MKSYLTFFFVALFAFAPFNIFANESIEEAIQKVLSVEKNGQGHAEAVEGMKTLHTAKKSDIPKLLVGMDLANRISANWLRGAIVSAAQREGNLPVQEITNYFNDSAHSHLGRLMAFELLSDHDATFAETTIPKLADDSSLPLRAMGIKWHIEQAKKAENRSEAIGILGVALDKARDLTQIDTIAGMLKEHGVPVDIQKLGGFMNTWHVVGVFDNKDEGGFDVAYGPEKDIENTKLDNVYVDNDGNDTKWKQHSTVERTGLVDLAEVIGPIKGVTAYARTVFNAEEATSAEIRIGCINAHKVWVNGNLVVSNEIYHNGIAPDKFAGETELKKGENVILIKVCQNEQTQPWAQQWRFQLRVCDHTGKAIEPTEVQPANY